MTQVALRFDNGSASLSIQLKPSSRTCFRTHGSGSYRTAPALTGLHRPKFTSSLKLWQDCF